MRRIAVTLSKGGTAKTTTAVNLSLALDLADEQLLLVDTDRKYFTARGLGISQGVRMWIAERMEDEGLR